MLETKKIFLIFLSTMLLQLNLSAKTLMITSQAEMKVSSIPGVPPAITLAPLETTAFIKYRLATCDFYSHGTIDDLLTEHKPKMLLISALHGSHKFTFYFPDGSTRDLTDDELVAALTGRGTLSPVRDEKRTIELVFLNGCNTKALCERIQAECDVPVVLGWDGKVVSQRALTMSFMFFRVLELSRLMSPLGTSEESLFLSAFDDAVTTTKRLCKTDELNIFQQGIKPRADIVDRRIDTI